MKYLPELLAAIILAGCGGTTTTVINGDAPMPPDENLTCCIDDINARFPQNEHGHYGDGVIFGSEKICKEWVVFNTETNMTVRIDFESRGYYFYDDTLDPDYEYGVSTDGRSVETSMHGTFTITKFLPHHRWDNTGTKKVNCYEIDGAGYPAMICPW